MKMVMRASLVPAVLVLLSISISSSTSFMAVDARIVVEDNSSTTSSFITLPVSAMSMEEDELQHRDEEEDEEDFLVILNKDRDSPRSYLQDVCNKLHQPAANHQWKRASVKLSAWKCNLHLRGFCKRFYNSKAIAGFSGRFSASQITALRGCLPHGTIAYMERDHKVHAYVDEFNPTQPQGQRVSAHAGTFIVDQHAEFTDPANFTIQKMSKNAAHTDGRHVDANGRISTTLWNLDRLDQRELPLDGFFGQSNKGNDGAGVHVYVIDSGVQSSHREFRRHDSFEDLMQQMGESKEDVTALAGLMDASRVMKGIDFVEDDEDPEDCDGHGSHVSGVIAGNNVGIAPKASIHAVRVLDCHGDGKTSDVIAALDWVAKHAELPAVITLSLGVSAGEWSRALEEAVTNMILNVGILVIVASGNSAVDACDIAPANVPHTLTIGASDFVSNSRTVDKGFNIQGSEEDENVVEADSMYAWSNWGSCVDMVAPGVDIYSACGGTRRCHHHSDSAYAWASGTSMAVPHVAGVAALYLQKHPHVSPQELKAALVQGATRDAIQSNLLRGTPNRLLYSSSS